MSILHENSKIKHLVEKMAQSSPYAIVVCAVVVSCITRNKWAFYFLATYILFAQILNHILKWFLKKLFQGNPVFERPSPPNTGCSLFDNCSASMSPTFGMPSGHSQSITFTAVFLTLFIQRQSNLNDTLKISYISVIWLLSLSVCYSRFAIGCHSQLQIAMGMLLGGMMGSASYFVAEKWFKEDKE